MHRIDDPSAVAALPTPRQPGTPGYFTQGSPTTGEQATIVSDDWANATQEELCFVIEQSGLTLSKTDRTQLFQAIARLTRRRLSAPITFYVSPTGDDANDGLTTSTPWASINHAYNYIRDRIDLNGFQSTIQLADGTYSAGGCQFPCIGPAPIIQGNLADASKVVVTNPNGPAITSSSAAIIICHNFTVSGSGGSGDYGAVGVGLLSVAGGIIFHANMNFATCSTAHCLATSGSSVGPIQTNVLWNITGAAPSHLMSWGGALGCADAHISIAPSLNFSGGFCNAQQGGLVQAWNCTFTGAATGMRYFVSGNGIIETNGAGANYFPGDAAGVVQTGGQYL
jgi:hypothetical protein